MTLDPQRSLVTAFNFRVALNRSAGGAGGGASAGIGGGVSVSAGASIGAALGAGASAGAGASVGASVSASASIGVGFGLGTSSGQLGDGGFQECTGLQIDMDVEELTEGGRNDGTVRLLGRGKYTNIVLKRGMLYPVGGTAVSELWGWLQGLLSGQRPAVRYDGVIEVLDQASQKVVATWVFDRGVPARIVGPTLNARSGEIAMEELTIAHEGLRLRI